MLKREAAERLGVSPARVSQLIRDGHLAPESDGSITPEAVEHCRRHAPIAWQHPQIRSGRKSHAQIRRESLDAGWRSVAAKMRSKGYPDWQGRDCAGTWRDLRSCIQATDARLLED